MARFFGENGGERAVGPIFSVLADFIVALKDALKKYDEKQAAELRKEKRQSATKRKQDFLEYDEPDKAIMRGSSHSEELLPIPPTSATRTSSSKSLLAGSWDDESTIVSLNSTATATSKESIPDPRADLMKSIVQRANSFHSENDSNPNEHRAAKMHSMLQRKDSKEELDDYRNSVESPSSTSQDSRKLMLNQILQRRKDDESADMEESSVTGKRKSRYVSSSAVDVSKSEDYNSAVTDWKKHRGKRIDDFRGKLLSAKESCRSNFDQRGI